MDCDVSPKTMEESLDENERNNYFLAPVWGKDKLEKLLSVTTDVCKKKPEDFLGPTDLRCFLDLTISFGKVLDDDLIQEWEPYMHNDVNTKCKKIVELCVCKMDEDSIHVLEALALVLDPNNGFHTFNISKISESVPPGSDIPDEKVYARPAADPTTPRGWLVDLINRFGDLDGFLVLLTKFQPGHRKLTLSIIHALLRPFGLCHEQLTVDTVVKYFMPVVERVHAILDALTDEELQEATTTASFNYDLSGTIGAMKRLVLRVPDQEKIQRNLDLLKRKIILRLTQTTGDVDESLNEWNLLLELFQTNWKTANEEKRAEMLKSLEKWAKDIQVDAMVYRVLEVLWGLVYSDEVSMEIMEKALKTHVRVFTFFNPQGRDDKIFVWLDKCIDKLKSDEKWTVPALNHIGEFCDLYMTDEIDDDVFDVENVLQYLEDKYSLMTLVINNLTNYMDKMRQLVRENPVLDEKTFMPDGRYIHETQVQTRLEILLNSVCHALIFPEIGQAKLIWQSLVEQEIFSSDRELCFSFFHGLGYMPSFKPAMKDIFEHHILQLDPTLLTSCGISCFKKFFLTVNKDEEGKTKVDDIIGKKYLWRVVTTSPEKAAYLGFQLLRHLNELVGSQLKLSDSIIRRTFVAECQKQIRVHNDTILLLMESKNIKKDHQAVDSEIAVEEGKRRRVMVFLLGFMIGCGWGDYLISNDSD